MSNVREVEIKPMAAGKFDELLGIGHVGELMRTAVRANRTLGHGVIWNVSGAAIGGERAGMLYKLLGYASGMGVATRWLAIDGDEDFSRVTSRLHSALHGELEDSAALDAEERSVYERNLEKNAAELAELVAPGDVVILHEHQTAGLIPKMRDIGASVIWRCNIRGDSRSDEGNPGWSFLKPYLRLAHSLVFSRRSHVPDFCDPRQTAIIAPSIDPFCPRNQQLSRSAVRSILTQAGVIDGTVDPNGLEIRLSEGGTAQVCHRADVMRVESPPSRDTPLVVQISRWEDLDHQGLLEGFCRAAQEPGFKEPHLVLAGPEVCEVADDPEGRAAHQRVVESWRGLPLELRKRVHLVRLPEKDRLESALMVNALQRHASVVVHKSSRDTFGLAVTEVMWKARPVIASAVGGIRDQIEHGINGLLLEDAVDVQGLTNLLRRATGNFFVAEQLGRHGKKRVAERNMGVLSLMQILDVIEQVHQANPHRRCKLEVREARI